MSYDRAVGALLALAVVIAAGIGLAWLGVLPAPWSDDAGDVRIVGDGGETKAAVDVEVADTHQERYTGLSDHDSLEPGEGMLFVHDNEGDRTYVMREMAFGIDIVFVREDGSITEIHNARAPKSGEDGAEMRYSGRAKWVLEVPYGYTDERGIEPGDELVIDDLS